MASVSTMTTINNVIKKFGSSMQSKLMREAKSELVRTVILTHCYAGIGIVWKLVDGAELPGEIIALDDLRDRFPLITFEDT